MNNKYSINKNKIPKTHREMLPKKNKMLIKNDNINNNNIQIKIPTSRENQNKNQSVPTIVYHSRICF